MKNTKSILFISFFFEPDLSAGSFRNTSLFKEILKTKDKNVKIHVITTTPNRYKDYEVKSNTQNVNDEDFIIERVKITQRKGLLGQTISFNKYFFSVLHKTWNNDYDVVYASTSKLFSGFLGATISVFKRAKLYLDIRDIFRETIQDMFSNKHIGTLVIIPLKVIEYVTCKRAIHINLITPGFRSYFNIYKKPTYSCYTNGIDQAFIKAKKSNVKPNISMNKIVYAGNIGFGQGLEKVIPQAAQRLGEKWEFHIYGAGNSKNLLQKKISKLQVKNVILHKAIQRERLLEVYDSADFLFMHLNNLKAFERALPSKLFESATYGNPIIARVTSTAATFINKNIKNVILFKPCDFENLVKKLLDYKYVIEDRKDFLEAFSRQKINRRMAKSILDLL